MQIECELLTVPQNLSGGCRVLGDLIGFTCFGSCEKQIDRQLWEEHPVTHTCNSEMGPSAHLGMCAFAFDKHLLRYKVCQGLNKIKSLLSESNNPIKQSKFLKNALNYICETYSKKYVPIPGNPESHESDITSVES